MRNGILCQVNVHDRDIAALWFVKASYMQVNKPRFLTDHANDIDEEPVLKVML